MVVELDVFSDTAMVADELGDVFDQSRLGFRPAAAGAKVLLLVPKLREPTFGDPNSADQDEDVFGSGEGNVHTVSAVINFDHVTMEFVTFALPETISKALAMLSSNMRRAMSLLSNLPLWKRRLGKSMMSGCMRLLTVRLSAGKPVYREWCKSHA